MTLCASFYKEVAFFPFSVCITFLFVLFRILFHISWWINSALVLHFSLRTWLIHVHSMKRKKSRPDTLLNWNIYALLIFLVIIFSDYYFFFSLLSFRAKFYIFITILFPFAFGHQRNYCGFLFFYFLITINQDSWFRSILSHVLCNSSEMRPQRVDKPSKSSAVWA